MNMAMKKPSPPESKYYEIWMSWYWEWNEMSTVYIAWLTYCGQYLHEKRIIYIHDHYGRSRIKTVFMSHSQLPGHSVTVSVFQCILVLLDAVIVQWMQSTSSDMMCCISIDVHHKNWHMHQKAHARNKHNSWLYIPISVCLVNHIKPSSPGKVQVEYIIEPQMP